VEPRPQLMVENATPVSISVCVCVVPNESWVCVPVVNSKPMELQKLCKEERETPTCQLAMFLPHPPLSSNARSSLFYYSKLSLQRRKGERPSLYLAVFLPLPLFLLMLEALSSITQSFLFKEERGRGLASTLQCSFPSPSFF
jgi:hypothetical protein